LGAQQVPIHWIVVENANATSPKVARLLERSGLSYKHLFHNEKRVINSFKAGGVRNQGLLYMRSLQPHPDSVLYFAGSPAVIVGGMFID
jgi:hypothetical protein